MAGVFLLPPEVMLSTTSAPESADVMIKLQMSIKPSTFKTIAKGNFSKNTYRAVEAFSPTAVANEKSPSISPNMVVPPKAENHRKVTIAGRKSTPSINSRMVLPLEILAIKVPTKGDHDAHQPQYMSVTLLCQESLP